MTARDRFRSSGVTCHDGHAIGLDLGATGARAAVLAVRDLGGEAHVATQQVGGIPLEPGTVVDGVVADPSALTAALKELWREQGIGCKNVILGIANPKIQVRDLQMPDLDLGQRARALPYQAREVIAMPLEQVVLDFAPLGGPEPETHLVDGILVACPREPVAIAVAAVEAAGLKVVRVDLSSFAVLRSAATQGLAAEAIIDIGAQLTTIVVHEHGVPKLVRTLTRGGEELTRRLAERLGMSLQDAEEVKRRDGLADPGEVATILAELVAPLVTDIRTSLNYFRTGNAEARIEQVALTGRAALLPGLIDAIGAQVGATTVVAEPARLLEPPTKRKKTGFDQRWATAQSIGLAIGAAA
jgi:type IV pilus assembly protein PilM